MLRVIVLLAAAVGSARAQIVSVSPRSQMPLGLPAPLPCLNGTRPLTMSLSSPFFVSVLPQPAPVVVSAVKAPQAVALAVAGMTDQMDAVKQASPDAQKLNPAQASRMGEKSFGVLGGVKIPAMAGVDYESQIYWGKPAGDSIGEAARAHFGGSEEAPEPAAPSLSGPVTSRSNPVVGWIKQAGLAVAGFVARRNPFRK